MSDGLELFDDLAEDDERDKRRSSRGRRPPPKARKKRRGRKWAIFATLIIVIVAGAYFGYKQLAGFGSHPDFTGNGTTDTVFQVNPGDTVTQIGDNMQTAGIVESSGAFVAAGRANTQLTGVQPGFYVLKEHMSGAAAVAKLTAAASRVGLLEIKSGQQLDDTTSTSGAVTTGILSHIAKAACATLDGKSTCLTVADLQTAIANTAPATLDVPSWAVPSVASADPKHRLEGLIMPGVYNVKPGETAAQTLKRIMDQSSAELQAAGLPGNSQQSLGFTPYQVLTMASIVEREAGTTADMPKIARVFYNRLQRGMALGSDATVDYALDRPMVATAPSDRPRAGLYNTYDHRRPAADTGGQPERHGDPGGQPAGRRQLAVLRGVPEGPQFMLRPDVRRPPEERHAGAPERGLLT